MMAIGFNKEKQIALVSVHAVITGVLAGMSYDAAANGKPLVFALICAVGVVNSYRLGLHYSNWRQYT